tara:strand:+ start:244 stop:954 length:711 start_codon:yes stop_codon:yes gene_type:complete
MQKYKLKVFDNKEDLTIFSTKIVANILREYLLQKDRIQVALSGGSTPAEMYKLLGEELLDWEKIDLFLGDERWVHHDDNSSNTRLINRTILSSSKGKKATFHTVPTTQLKTVEDSSKELDKLLRMNCSGDPAVFDLILLGLGDDGHTASLFPGSESLSIKDRWTASTYANGHSRITLTFPVLSAAKQVVFLVSGDSKKVALKRLIDPNESPLRTPAKLVNPISEILILTDQSIHQD